MSPCVSCGKPDDKFGYLCQECYLKEHPIILSRPRLRLTLCRKCGTFLASSVWRPSPDPDHLGQFLVDAVAETISNKYKFRQVQEQELNILEIDERLLNWEEGPDVIEGRFELMGRPDPFFPTIRIEEEFTMYIRYRSCSFCQQVASGGMINAKIQIRGAERQLDHISTVLKEYFDEIKRSGSPGEHPIKQEETKDGWDISFTSSRTPETIASLLKEEYGAMLIRTNETITYDRMKSKAKTRLVISARLPNFLRGDIILYRDQPFQLFNVRGTQTTLFDFGAGEVVLWDNKQLWDTRTKLLYPYEELQKFQVFSIQEHTGTAELMNMATFEMHELTLDKFSRPPAEGTEVRGFYWSDAFYIDKI